MRYLPNFSLLHLSILYLAASFIIPSVQADVLNHVRQRGQLIVGVEYVNPPYSAGAKYRTPESLVTEAGQALANNLNVTVVEQGITPQNRLKLLTAGIVDVLLVRASKAEILVFASQAKVIETGYQAQPKLIMRTDTDIKQWSQLNGRRVCVSQGSPYSGNILLRYGAREMVMRAPADALLALRTGQCDATIHDDILLDGILSLPEWKKFSAILAPSGPTTQLVWVLRAADRDLRIAATSLMREWGKNGFWSAARKKWVNDVAFEVYLDQTVPDCH